MSAPLAQRQQALADSLATGTGRRAPLGNGAMGQTNLVNLKDGTQAVYKRAKMGWPPSPDPADTIWDEREQTDAEYLAAAVAAALGVSAPAVQKVSDDELFMEVVPGQPAIAALLPDGSRPGDGSRRQDELVRSDAGARMGLLDMLLDNPDRHKGNWMVDDDGGIHAIDHGLAFLNFGGPNVQNANGPFVAEHFQWGYGDFKDNPLTPRDIEVVDERLEQLRPLFEEIGREEWLDATIARLVRVGAHATGTRDLIA